jgi:NAD(P)-dependent dehydrogenase (short-subunit alcohol dehydrogenase family)
VTSAFRDGSWALILGGSSGFGLATARKLGEQGMNLFIVHRDRRGAMRAIEPEFEKLRGLGVGFHSWNTDATSEEPRAKVIDAIAELIGEGRIRVLLHSIAFGNLKLIAPEKKTPRTGAEALAKKLGVEPDVLLAAADELLAEGEDALNEIATPAVYSDRSYLDEEDFARTILSMGTSLLGWTQSLYQRGLFDDSARIFGLTSEGNELAWKGYAAVSAAKVALESLGRSIAVEYGPYGIRCNIIQAGITDTPALRAIPGNEKLVAQARLRNPGGRLTEPRDVANMIYLLSLDEAAWVNGDVIRVDGGEHVSGVTS